MPVHRAEMLQLLSNLTLARATQARIRPAFARKLGMRFLFQQQLHHAVLGADPDQHIDIASITLVYLDNGLGTELGDYL